MTLTVAIQQALADASATLEAILRQEIAIEPDLVETGEATIRVPTLEIDPGAASVSLVWRPAFWLDHDELDYYRDLARQANAVVHLGTALAETGSPMIVVRLVFRRNG